MTVKVRPYKRGGWEVDIMLTIPGRPKIRERRKAPVGTKSAAKRWGEDRERQLIQHYTNTDPTEDGEDDRPDVATKEVPTLAKFIPRYMEGHCKANRLRPATIESRESAFRSHLIPAFGRKRLDRITAEDIQRFKGERAHLKNSSVNLLLTYLSGILGIAVEWNVIDKMPVKIKKLKAGPPDFQFYDFEEFDRLVLAAEQTGNPNHLLTVLLGGEAGLRCGEMQGLQWSDIDMKRATLTVARAVWRGHVGLPKGGRSRTIPLAPRLRDALAEHRHLRGPHVLCTALGTRPTSCTIRRWLVLDQQTVGFKACGPHVLRHTFCSHLAMMGKPIKELAGHRSITTTERYMHLAPAVARDAIEGLRRPANWRHVGDALLGLVKLQQCQ